MELREHQSDAIQQIRQLISQGHRRIILAATTSFGKTVVAAHMMLEAQRKGKRGVMICDRIQLVEQSLEKFDAMGLDCGVIQGQHHRTKYSAPIQIASIQTLSRRSRLSEFDFAMVDEAHTMYEALAKMMTTYNNVPFIGLTATPYSKGLGKHYTAMVVPITTRELLEMGWLCPVKYYAGESPDLEKIKLKGLPTGGRDYDPGALSIEMEKPKLIGNVVDTWKKLGEDSQTIAFCPSVKHSEGLVKAFQDAGVPSVHIDSHTDPEDRKRIYEQHNNGDFKILSCCVLLNTGYDSPSTRCIIDCRPTKSLIAYCQRAGRIMRTNPGKEYAIYLDHASNVCTHGFPEDIVPEELHDGEKEYNEKEQVKKEATEKEPRACGNCGAIMESAVCGACGAKMPPSRRELETVAGELQELKQKQVNQEFYSGLIQYGIEKKYNPGWAKNVYKEKFGEWPNGAQHVPLKPGADVIGYIKHRNIKRARAKPSKAEQAKGKQTIDNIMAML